MSAPRSLLHLAWVCNRLALQGFGGVLAVAQHEFVDREQWLTEAEFVELLGTAQLLPGPNVINLALMLGERHFGGRGMVAVLVGMCTLPLLLLLLIAALMLTQLQQPWVARALQGMAVAAAGLLLGTCWKLGGTVRRSPLGMPRAFALAAVAALLFGVLRLPLLPTLPLLVGAGMALARSSRS